MLDPDALARDLSPADPSAAAVAAGRQALKLTEEYLNAKVNFAVETTLAGHRIIALMRAARERGYEVNLAFVALEAPERCINRIRERVARGGHFIPDLDVRRRYARSFENLPEALFDLERDRGRTSSGRRAPPAGPRRRVSFNL
jgi:predicted ABC-type ATPase